MKSRSTLSFLVCFSLLIGHAQISADYIDDFENGTVQNWSDGGNTSNPPANINTGGPNGPNDNFLQDVSSGGNGAGSKMIMFNDQQWTGNFTNQGIIAIKFQARALTNSLNMRVAFDGAGGRICTTNAVQILSGGAWQEFIIPISSSDFTTVSGGTNIAQTLADVSDMRILSNGSPSWQGESIVATLQIDNIQASTTLSVQDLSSEESFKVFPNPAKDILFLKINRLINNSSVEIYNALGTQMIKKPIKSNNLIEVPISKLGAGIYFLKLITTNSSETVRFIKI